MNQDLVYFGWFTELECDIKSEPRSDRGERLIPFRVCHWSIVANQGLSLVENGSLRLSEHPSSPVLALPAQLLSWLDIQILEFWMWTWTRLSVLLRKGSQQWFNACLLLLSSLNSQHLKKLSIYIFRQHGPFFHSSLHNYCQSETYRGCPRNVSWLWVSSFRDSFILTPDFIN